MEWKARGGGAGATAALPHGGLKIGEADLRKGLSGLKYNTLDVEMTVKECLANASKEYADIKRRSHTALATGRDQMLSGNLKAANSSFAYQMRCTSDWIWVRALGNKGDQGHAAFLTLSRAFGKLAAGKKTLSAAEQKTIQVLIAKIRG